MQDAACSVTTNPIRKLYLYVNEASGAAPNLCLILSGMRAGMPFSRFVTMGVLFVQRKNKIFSLLTESEKKNLKEFYDRRHYPLQAEVRVSEKLHLSISPWR